MVLRRCFSWVVSFFQPAEKHQTKLVTASAFAGVGLLLLSLGVAYQNNHLPWAFGKIYFQLLGKGSPIDAKAFACAEPFYGPERVKETTPCFQTAAAEWEAEVEKMSELVQKTLPERGTGMTKASFQKDLQVWKAARTKQLALSERQLNTDPNKELKLAQVRMGIAQQRATDLQRFLAP